MTVILKYLEKREREQKYNNIVALCGIAEEWCFIDTILINDIYSFTTLVVEIRMILVIDKDFLAYKVHKGVFVWTLNAINFLFIIVSLK